MARENQGLQIALIVFVMLTILLGVTTYLFFRKYDETFTRETAKTTELNKKTQEANDNAAEVAKLKGMVDLAPTDKADAVFAEDMKKYGNAYPEESRLYRRLLDRMQKTIDEKAKALDLAMAENKDLKDKFAVREANKEPQIKEIEQARDKAREDLTTEQAKLKTDRERIADEAAKLNTDLAAARKTADTSLANIDKKLQDAIKQIRDRTVKNQQLSGQLQKLISEDFEGAEGDVRWVNQRTGTVWISLGRADALRRQVTFGVYPANTQKMTTGGKKGSIEVTQILGDHLAEARFYDDKITDPIVAGDKIYTPVWTPGEQRHFALAGFVDLDGDGKNDVMKVKDIIAMNGGIIDAYIDDKGKLVGAVTINTRYLVKGVAPTEKGQANMAAWNKIFSEAKSVGVQEIPVDDLLHTMGWKNQMNVIEYGRGANTKNFGAKADEGAQKKSIGSVSDVFNQRTPPARVPTSAY